MSNQDLQTASFSRGDFRDRERELPRDFRKRAKSGRDERGDRENPKPPAKSGVGGVSASTHNRRLAENFHERARLFRRLTQLRQVWEGVGATGFEDEISEQLEELSLSDERIDRERDSVTTAKKITSPDRTRAPRRNDYRG